MLMSRLGGTAALGEHYGCMPGAEVTDMLDMHSSLAAAVATSRCYDKQLMLSEPLLLLSHPQVAALRCVASFILSLEDNKERDSFQPMVPGMLAALGRCLQGGDEPSAQEALESLIEVADTHPKFLKKHLPDVVSAMLQVSSSTRVHMCCSLYVLTKPLPSSIIGCHHAVSLQMAGSLMAPCAGFHANSCWQQLHDTLQHPLSTCCCCCCLLRRLLQPPSWSPPRVP